MDYFLIIVFFFYHTREKWRKEWRKERYIDKKKKEKEGKKGRKEKGETIVIKERK